jgi:hypothetical protein
MLTIIVAEEGWDSENEVFVQIDPFTLELEHSLVSLSKWESIYKKPFLSAEKTVEETIDYIRLMIVTPDYPPDILSRLSKENVQQIEAYIASPESATVFNSLYEEKPKGRQEVITSELIYFWLVAFTIPFDCENWHLNRLLNLVRIYSAKNQKPKKMSRHELSAHYRDLNRKRREEAGTSG